MQDRFQSGPDDESEDKPNTQLAKVFFHINRAPKSSAAVSNIATLAYRKNHVT
jgi:hypothetical protein